MQNKHSYFMDLAIDLALKAKGGTFPNPLVGAVVVKNGKVVGQGWHKKAGGPHAEVLALKQAKIKAKGADLYVTLEPCSYFGRTPPCTDIIIKHGIKRVFVGVRDPNPLVKGVEILNKHRIKTKVGILKEKVKEINLQFFKYMSCKMPFITCKIAQSIDGKIAMSSGESKWITSAASRNFAKKQRKFYDGIMIGINTVLKDNPKLNSPRKINKIIVDSSLKTPAEANIFKSKDRVIIATLKAENSVKVKQLKKVHKSVLILNVKAKNSKIDLKDMLKKLAELEITSILCEGGSALNSALIDGKLVDKFNFYIAPKIIGGKMSLSSLSGKGVSKLSDAVKFKKVKIQNLGKDFFIEAYV